MQRTGHNGEVRSSIVELPEQFVNCGMGTIMKAQEMNTHTLFHIPPDGLRKWYDFGLALLMGQRKTRLDSILKK